MYGHRFINIETEEEDNMTGNQFASTIGALFQGMDEFVTTKTVVGEPVRSEERRVGKECRSRWSPYH